MKVALLSAYEDLADAVMESMCSGPRCESAVTEVDGRRVEMVSVAGDPDVCGQWENTIEQARGVLLIIRFLDKASLDKLRKIYARLAAIGKPVILVLLREEGEADFKISCSSCGQKLWVRDCDHDKRGRCPNCKRSFELPGQENHVRRELSLPDGMSIRRISRGDRQAASSVLSELIKEARGALVANEQDVDADTLKKSTVRVQITPE